MGRVLASTVILTDELTGQPIVFNAGDEPEKKYAKQITNPKAWGEDDGEEPEADPEPEEEVDPEDGDDEDDDVDPEDETEEDKAPAKSAKVEVWKEYAESKGIELGDDATKKDYQDAVSALS